MEKTDYPKNSSQKENKGNKSKPYNNYTQYIKYSGLAMQMAILVAIGYWIGKTLDDWLETGYPIFMIITIFLFLFVSIFALIKNLPKD